MATKQPRLEKAKATHGKREGTRYLKKHVFQECHTTGPSWKEKVGIWAGDALQLLRKVTPDKEPIMGSVALRKISQPAYEAMTKGSATVVALCFDVYQYVPMAKGEEQRARDSRASKKEDEDSFTSSVRIPYTEVKGELYDLNEPIPWDWDAILHDREGAKGRQALIRWLCLNFCEGACEIPIHPGKKLYIFGHCFGREECEILDLDPDLTDMATYPICITLDRKGDRVIRFDTELRNEVGEAEFQFAFLYDEFRERRFMRDTPYIELVSTDSDVFYIALTSGMKAIWSYDAKNDFHLDIARVRAHLCDDLVNLPFTDPVWALVACAYAAGSDYTWPWGGLTHEHFMVAFFENKTNETISSRLCEKGTLDPEGFLDLMLAAYSVAKCGVKKMENYRLFTLDQARSGGFPREGFISDRYMQLVFALDMLKRARNAYPTEGAPDPFEYGYEESEEGFLIRKAQGWKA
jgi:hypothetical protein